MEHEAFLHDWNRSSLRRLVLSLALTLALIVVEVLAGLFARSLALLTDAAHNFTDILALALSAWAVWIAAKPPHAGKTYGYHRAGTLVALVNSLTLVVIAVGIFYEAYKRFRHSSDVQADLLIGVGLAAVVLNLVTALLIRRGAKHDLNLRSAFVHLVGDVLSTIGAVIAGVVIRFTGWNWLDPFVSVLIGFLILWNAIGILREALHILMESTPSDVDMERLQRDILTMEGVRGVHDLHVWSIDGRMRFLSAHLVTADVPLSVGVNIQSAVRKMLADRHAIRHVTLQLECADCSSNNLYCTQDVFSN
ncbi:MAG: cation diffusion facilitator family transporter [Anaerolineales bacterium]|nr:cation diffusion facilitator family transporter [Anaerolineales bacterium]MCX7609302.1 cation diffusion facilitator family transporter [Anaerolineales bacterium]MDW8226974.1 cation diffusion facilitator family transporter [Anaerolineales bacterium]